MNNCDAEDNAQERSGDQAEPSPQPVEPSAQSPAGDVPDASHEPEKAVKGREAINWPAWIQAGCTVLLVVITGLYTFYTSGMTKANIDAATAAKSNADIAMTELRPWLKVTRVRLRHGNGPLKTLMFQSPSAGAPFVATLQFEIGGVNLGHTLAHDISIFPELFFYGGPGGLVIGGDPIGTEQDQHCRSVLGGRNGAEVAFPSDTWGWDGTVSGGPAFNGQNSVLIFCVNYRGLPGTTYQTAGHAQLTELGGRVPVDIGTNMDASDLQVDHDPGSDNAD